MKNEKDNENIAPEKALKNTTENNRRKALKKVLITGSILTASGSLPKNWARPVVDSIILPAHAATTDNTGSAGGDATTTAAPTVNYFYQPAVRAQLADPSHTQKSFAERTLNMVIPTASAYSAPNSRPTYVCLAITGNTYTGRIVRRPYSESYQDFDGISGTVGNDLLLDSASQPCSQTGIFSFTLKVDQVTANSCRCTLTDHNAESFSEPVELTVQQGTCGQPRFDCGG